MLRLAIVLAVLSPSVVFAGQAAQRFTVGITITDGGSSSPMVRQKQTAKTTGGMTAITRLRRDPLWMFYCFAKYSSFDPANGTYLGDDGRTYFCQ